MSVGFDNATDRVQSASPPSGSNWSIGGLFNIATNAGAYAMIFALENSGATQFQEVGFNPSNQLVLIDHSGGGTELLNQGTITTGSWYWVFYCLGSGSADFYFGPGTTNPTLTKLTSAVTTVTTPSALRFASTSANEFMTGWLRGFKVWNTTKLTTSEVQAECADLAFVKTSGKHALYLFQNSALKLEDETGNQRVLTGSGGAWTDQADPSIPYSGIVDGTTALYLRSQAQVTSQSDRLRLSIGQGILNVDTSKTNHSTGAAVWRQNRPLNTTTTSPGTPPVSVTNIGWKIDPVDMGATVTNNRTIASGVWTFNFIMLSTSSQASALTTIYVEVYRISSGGTATLLFGFTSSAIQVTTTAGTKSFSSSSQPAYQFDDAETLQVELFTNAPGAVGNQVITLRLESTTGTDSNIAIPALGSVKVIKPSLASVPITVYNAAVSQVISPNLATAAVTVYAPALSQVISGALTSIPITVPLATVTQSGQQIDGALTSIPVTLYAPTIEQNIGGALTSVPVTVNAPAVEQNIGGALTSVPVTVYAPGVEFVVSPALATAPITVYAPALEYVINAARVFIPVTGYGESVEQVIAADRVDAAITVYAPAVGLVILPALATAPVTIYAPAIAQVISADRVDAAITVYAPDVGQLISAALTLVPVTVFGATVEQNIGGALTSIPVTFLPPVVDAAGTIAPLRVDVPLTVFAPTIAQVISGALTSVPLAVFAPAVEQVIGGTRADFQITVYAPALAQVISAALTSVPVTFPLAAVVATGNQTINALRVDAAVTVFLHMVDGASSIIGAPVSVPVTVYAPAVGLVISPQPVGVGVDFYQPAVSPGAATIAGALVPVVITVPGASVAQVISSLRVDLALQLQTPTVNPYNVINPERVGVACYPPAPAVVPGALTIEPEPVTLPLTLFAPSLAQVIRVLSVAVPVTFYLNESTVDEKPPASIFDGLKPGHTYPRFGLGAFRRQRDKNHPDKG